MKLLMNSVNQAREKGRYCVIFDKNGNVPVFFHKKQAIVPFMKEIVAYRADKITKEGALETLRAGLVNAMRVGSAYAINLGSLAPDFNSEFKDEKLWPFDEIADFDEWREDEKYLKIVKEEENKDILGDKGNFSMA